MRIGGGGGAKYCMGQRVGSQGREGGRIAHSVAFADIIFKLNLHSSDMSFILRTMLSKL